MIMWGYNKCECRPPVKVQQCPLTPTTCPRNHVRSRSPECPSKSPVCYSKPEHTRCYSAPPCKLHMERKLCRHKNFQLEPTITKVSLRQFSEKANCNAIFAKVEKPKQKSPSKQQSVKSGSTSKEEVKKSDGKENEAKKGDVKEKDVKKPDSKEKEVKKPDSKEKEVKKPDSKEKEVIKSGGKEKEVIKDDSKEKEVRKSVAKDKDSKKSTASTESRTSEAEKTKQSEVEADETVSKHSITKTRSSVNEHEYIHFLLKITEDILRNNLYTESAMNALFDSHVAANKERLDEDKMRSQIEGLKKELNLPIPKTAQMCQCEEEPESKSVDCKCCPAYDAQDKAGSCACNNPKCPARSPEYIKKPVVEDEIPSAVIEPERIQTEEMQIQEKDLTIVGVLDEPSSAELSGSREIKERVDREEVDHSTRNGKSVKEETPKKPVEDSVVLGKDKTECIAPTLCHSFNTSKFPVTTENGDNESRPTMLMVQSASGAINGMSKQSMVKIVNKDDPNDSQIIFYNPETGEHCFCNISLQKTALKIQLDENDKNEEYILVDGPVCLPRTILENKTIPVMIQNMSSLLLDSDFEVHTTKEQPSFSRVNLFHQASHVHPPYPEDMTESVSAQFSRKADILPPERDPNYEMSLKKKPIGKKAVQSDSEIKTTSFVSSKEEATDEKKEKPSFVGDEASIRKSPSLGSAKSKQGPESPDKKLPKPSNDEIRKSISAFVDPELIAEFAQPKKCNKETCPKKSSSTMTRRVKKTSSADDKQGPGPGSQDERKGKSEESVTDRTGRRSGQESEKRVSGGSRKSTGSGRSESRSFVVSEAEAARKRSGSKESDQIKREMSSSGGSLTTTAGETDTSSEASSQRKIAESPKRSTSSRSFERSKSTELKKGAEEGEEIGGDETNPKALAPMVDDEFPEIVQGDESNVQDFKNEPPSTENDSDFAKKYHYLLMDAATSTSSCRVPDNLPPRTSSGAISSKGSLGKEYMLIVEEQTKAENTSSQSHKSVESPPKVESQKLSEMKIFQYGNRPTQTLLSPQVNPNEFSYFSKKESDELTEHTSDIESLRKSSNLDDKSILPEAEGRRKSSLPIRPNDPEKVSEYSESSFATPQQNPRVHEGLKVRYSLSRDAYNPAHQDIIAKLDEMPTAEAMTKDREESVAAITDKMREFRKIDSEENANRRFQISNPENFEIRRLSNMENPTESDDGNKKAKRTCCGLVQPSKAKKRVSGSSMTDSRGHRSQNL